MEEKRINSVREYNAFLAKNGLYKEGAPTIMLTGMFCRILHHTSSVSSCQFA